MEKKEKKKKKTWKNTCIKFKKRQKIFSSKFIGFETTKKTETEWADFQRIVLQMKDQDPVSWSDQIQKKNSTQSFNTTTTQKGNFTRTRTSIDYFL